MRPASAAQLQDRDDGCSPELRAALELAAPANRPPVRQLHATTRRSLSQRGVMSTAIAGDNTEDS